MWRPAAEAEEANSGSPNSSSISVLFFFLQLFLSSSSSSPSVFFFLFSLLLLLPLFSFPFQVPFSFYFIFFPLSQWNDQDAFFFPPYKLIRNRRQLDSFTAESELTRLSWLVTRRFFNQWVRLMEACVFHRQNKRANLCLQPIDNKLIHLNMTLTTCIGQTNIVLHIHNHAIWTHQWKKKKARRQKQAI